MYSGFILPKKSVSAVGVHQRFNKVAYRVIQPYISDTSFPSQKQILHFEGINGPDGLKTKSPGKNEPSHLYDPYEETGAIPALIETHYGRLVDRLKQRDSVGAAFEAAWLAHYVCDGLTPAHHFPLGEQLEKHGFKKNKAGKYVVDKKGLTHIDVVRKAWKVVGGKGLLTTHVNFEIGAATVILGQRIKVKLDLSKLTVARRIGPINFFKTEALDIASLNMYEKFYRNGWTPELARLTKNRLAPQIVQAIAIFWLLAYLESGEVLAKEAAAVEVTS